MIIKVKGENKVYMINGGDHVIRYDVKENSNGSLWVMLEIDQKQILARPINNGNVKKEISISEMQDNMESLVCCICDLESLSAMGTNQNVFRIVIDPETLIGNVTRTGEAAMLNQYGLHPSQN